VWFKYTPSANITLDIDTSGSDFGPIVSVWTGTSHPMMSLGCAYGRFAISATAGTTYYIRAAGGSVGNLNINLKDAPALLNDNLSNATVISSMPHTSTQSTAASTREPSESLSSCTEEPLYDDLNSVWFKYTPSTDGVLSVNTSGVWTVLSLWTGSSHPLSEIGCSGSPTSTSGSLSKPVTAGTTYYNLSSMGF